MGSFIVGLTLDPMAKKTRTAFGRLQPLQTEFLLLFFQIKVELLRNLFQQLLVSAGRDEPPDLLAGLQRGIQFLAIMRSLVLLDVADVVQQFRRAGKILFFSQFDALTACAHSIDVQRGDFIPGDAAIGHRYAGADEGDQAFDIQSAVKPKLSLLFNGVGIKPLLERLPIVWPERRDGGLDTQ